VEWFPFTTAEWDAVSSAARFVLYAGLANDTDEQALHFVKLRAVLAKLRTRYGDHPVLLETEADFSHDNAERIALYRQAARIAAAHGIPTFSIRLALSRTLLETGERTAARGELMACEGEVSGRDDQERADWAALVAELTHEPTN
jgi:hypothetical protein